ncbi:PP2C family protein-serine/threonine phosphatase [Shimia marina]|uniref:Transcriptional regulatory protein AfsQ1 n=1 Tax=Shimia marina TaxID=321267 RepID=A0A0N7LRQ7_9RHOB|nr:SpoIIE family protein phosphatase [Shimia marina]CUH51492.1 Transcriptional regulatory protein AfsQ1 [Shimia marina]SFD47765.1 Serine phosphatase RsbU, regulator of sigma subunit [Shimia marina]
MCKGSEVLSSTSVQSAETGAPEAGVIKRVLLVDDSRVQRRILSLSLKRDGYDVIEAASGQEALDICREDPPDLILSDWMMPGMSGLEFCRAFRELKTEAYGYFILLTSKSEKTEVAQGFDAGADDFLTKPVNGYELRARISAAERILRMQRELTDKNKMISETLDELQRLYDSLDNDLLAAKKLQQSLVPERFRTFDHAAVSLLLQSSGHVGGDLVGHYKISETRIGLYAIDVSGHGISSALITARLAGYLSGSSPENNIAIQVLPDGTHTHHPPEQVVARLNEIILDEMETEHYFTMLLADVNLQTGEVILCQAGHPHPVVQRADGTIEQDGPGGLPVGLIPGGEFAQFTLKLNPGDRLFLLSDGVTECPDMGTGMLGETGLETLLKGLYQHDLESTLQAMVWKLDEFSGGKGFPDDVSGILMEYKD